MYQTGLALDVPVGDLLEEASAHSPSRHGGACACGAGPLTPLDRRGLLRGASAAVALLTLAPRLAVAAEGNYEAMILACIDPRVQEPVHAYAAKQGLIGNYSQFVIAGAAIGVVAPKFADWHKAFWDNLAVTVELHHIGKVIAIDHRDCAAAKLAYGDASVATPDKETQTHRTAMAEFRKEVAKRQPALAIETGLMALRRVARLRRNRSGSRTNASEFLAEPGAHPILNVSSWHRSKSGK